MGWIKPGRQRPSRTDYEQFLKREEAIEADEVPNIENVEYPIRTKEIQNEDLPFIPAETVMSRDGKQGSKLCMSATRRLETDLT